MDLNLDHGEWEGGSVKWEERKGLYNILKVILLGVLRFLSYVFLSFYILDRYMEEFILKMLVGE